MDDLRSPPAGWHPATRNLVRSTLGSCGLDAEQVRAVAEALINDGLVVEVDHYVPTFDELNRDYQALGVANLQGRINVRWVMCAETHDALKRRYSRTNYIVPPDVTAAFSSLQVYPSPDVLELTVRTVMERNRRWEDPGMLFGIPIRIDPVARRPVFEILPEEERHGV